MSKLLSLLLRSDTNSSVPVSGHMMMLFGKNLLVRKKRQRIKRQRRHITVSETDFN